jgi:hypothetical protein
LVKMSLEWKLWGRCGRNNWSMFVLFDQLDALSHELPSITVIVIEQSWARHRSWSTCGTRNNFRCTASPSSNRILYIVLKRSK